MTTKNLLVPPGMGELNYLQSLIAGMTNQKLNTSSSPTFVNLTLSGLTASLPVVTSAGKALASVSYAAFKSSLAIAQADVAGLTVSSSPTFAGLTLTTGAGAAKVWTSDAGGAGSWAPPAAPSAHVLDGALHTVAGETAGYFLKALSATTFGFAAHGLTYTDVGAEASGAVSTHNSSASAHGFTTAGKALANLANPSAITFPRVNADNTATLLSASDFRTAIGAGTSSFDGAYSSLSGKPTLGTASAQDVGYFDLAGVAAGAVSAHAALITGVHGLVFTAGKSLTMTASLTLNALPVGGLAVATAANTLGSLAVGLTTQVLMGGGAATVPAWGADLPTAVTIGTAYIYRAGGTDVAVADGGTNLSSYAVGDILFASGTTTIGKLADVAAGQPLLSGGLTTAPAYAGYTFSGTAAQTYTFPAATSTLLATTGSPAALVIASQATGDLLYASSATAWARLAIGAAGKVLTVNAGGTLPEWAAAASGPHTLTDVNNTVSGRTAGQMLRATAATTYGWTTNTWPDTAAIGTILYASAANVISALAAGATTDILVGGGAAAPVWTAATGTGAPMRGTSPTITTSLIMANGATLGQAAGPLLTFDDTGNYLGITGCNIGIGTTTPTARLSITTGGNSWTTAGWGRGIELANANVIKWVKGTNYAWGIAPSGDDLYFMKSTADDNSAAAAYPLFLKGSNGYVGIGTTAPGSPLAVVGLPTYTSNAAAAALSVGDFYINNIGPTYSFLCIRV